jgi:hypothetical protein
MTDKMFSETDLRQIRDEGLEPEQVLAQIELFERGMTPIILNRPCAIDDGIVTIKRDEIAGLIARHEQALQEFRVFKFVPASGAASRMFKSWWGVLEMGRFDDLKDKRAFFQDLKNYAFFQDLYSIITKKGEDIFKLLNSKNEKTIVEYILTPKGLDYGNLPKALLKFHVYPGGARTALEEHLVEAAFYATKRDPCPCGAHRRGSCHIHFTVSEDHRNYVENYLSEVKSIYENLYEVNLHIEISVQLPSTNTIAVDIANIPFRTKQGRLVFRPGGHGALLHNLKQIDGDIIFIKNIDNVVPDWLKTPTIIYKKILGGFLATLQEEVYRNLRLLHAEQMPDKDLISGIISFCERKLCIVFPAGFEMMSLREKIRFLIEKLDRPLRVCGVVKNEGEPGGGPFWVDEHDGTQSLQIVESMQIDESSDEQQAIWSSATHFNPVDMVCSVRNFRGKKFELDDYINPETFCIVRKTQEGKEFKALELPGLWNGSMALWNTIFVEVPIETFNPVKTVYDLLRPQHSRNSLITT